MTIAWYVSPKHVLKLEEIDQVGYRVLEILYSATEFYHVGSTYVNLKFYLYEDSLKKEMLFQLFEGK
jgi:hypothetical protein